MKNRFLAFALILVSLVLKTNAQTSFQVTVKGKGTPILLFAGFGCSGELWNETVAELSKTNECHIFTFAGFGGVPAIETPWFSTIKDEVIQYVKTKKLKKPTLVGHSLGGTLSLWLASLEKEMFKQLILVDALPCSAALMIPNYKGEKIPYDNPRNKMMIEMDKTAFENMNKQMIGFMCKNKEKQPIITNWMNMIDRKTYIYSYVDMLNLDLREDIAKISVPVTILAATSPDLATVQKTYNTQYEKLPSVKIHYAENAAHFVMYDQPEWFMKKLKEIL
ncbi:alpha/beta hydrolase [bacterium 336/3]|nr:alpha/beta hydrolase [bacterium 336/3]